MKQKNLFFFFGDDTYSLFQKINHWKNEFAKKHGDTNLEILNGQDLTAEYIKQAVETMPFLGEKRLIIIKNFISEGNPEEQKKTAEIFEKEIPDTCVIVFIETSQIDKKVTLFKRLKKYAQTTEFLALSGFELNEWIIKKVNKNGGIIDENAAVYLASIVGGNLWTLSNEIQKLCAYCEKRPITIIEIELLVNANLHISIFQLTDAIAQKNTKLSLETLHNLIESGEDLIWILFMIIRQFRLIIQVKDLKERGLRENEIIGKLKEHPFTIRNTMRQSGNFQIQTLKKIYNFLLDIDVKLKTGKIKFLATDRRDLTLALDRFITSASQL